MMTIFFIFSILIIILAIYVNCYFGETLASSIAEELNKMEYKNYPITWYSNYYNLINKSEGIGNNIYFDPEVYRTSAQIFLVLMAGDGFRDEVLDFIEDDLIEKSKPKSEPIQQHISDFEITLYENLNLTKVIEFIVWVGITKYKIRIKPTVFYTGFHNNYGRVTLEVINENSNFISRDFTYEFLKNIEDYKLYFIEEIYNMINKNHDFAFDMDDFIIEDYVIYPEMKDIIKDKSKHTPKKETK